MTDKKRMGFFGSFLLVIFALFVLLIILSLIGFLTIPQLQSDSLAMVYPCDYSKTYGVYDRGSQTMTLSLSWGSKQFIQDGEFSSCCTDKYIIGDEELSEAECSALGGTMKVGTCRMCCGSLSKFTVVSQDFTSQLDGRISFNTAGCKVQFTKNVDDDKFGSSSLTVVLDQNEKFGDEPDETEQPQDETPQDETEEPGDETEEPQDETEEPQDETEEPQDEMPDQGTTPTDVGEKTFWQKVQDFFTGWWQWVTNIFS